MACSPDRNIIIAVSYTHLDVYKRQVADIQLSVSAQNLFTLTKYTGMEPEVYSESDYGFNGVDMGSYPVPRTFTFGMKLNF